LLHLKVKFIILPRVLLYILYFIVSQHVPVGSG